MNGYNIMRQVVPASELLGDAARWAPAEAIAKKAMAQMQRVVLNDRRLLMRRQ